MLIDYDTESKVFIIRESQENWAMATRSQWTYATALMKTALCVCGSCGGIVISSIADYPATPAAYEAVTKRKTADTTTALLSIRAILCNSCRSGVLNISNKRLCLYMATTEGAI